MGASTAVKSVLARRGERAHAQPADGTSRASRDVSITGIGSGDTESA